MSKLKKQQGIEATYDYTNPILMLVLIGFVALFLAFLLKAIDKKNNYGLESPNV